MTTPASVRSLVALLVVGSLAACGSTAQQPTPPGAVARDTVRPQIPEARFEFQSDTLAYPLPPGDTRPVPAVVTISGSGPQDRDEQLVSDDYRPFRQIANTLARRGIATLRVDDRGVNESDPGPVGATSADFCRSRTQVDSTS